MHAKKPKIAAQWDAESAASRSMPKISGKKRVSKARHGGKLRKLGADLASNLKDATSAEERHKKRGRVSKVAPPVWPDDGFFNASAAQTMYDLVMKMDDDTAQVFCQVMASDLFEQEIENNLGTLQRHLNEVVAKRHAGLRQAIAKNADDPQAEQYWNALEEITKATRTPQYYGYQWEENDFRRDPSTGRFMVKIKRTMTKPLPEKQADKMIGDSGKDIADAKRRAQYQDEYRQVAAFLETASMASGGKGNVDIVYHSEDKAGNVFTSINNSGKVDKDLLKDPSTTLLAIEAKPTTLTTGGAAYGLASAMGHQLSPDQVRRANLGDDEFKAFSQNWANAGTAEQTTSRMYQRLSSTGSAMNTLGAPGGKVQLAGKMAEIVGQYGPQAEQVIGPTARKTAYRYRGTETTPDAKLVRVYGEEIADAKKYGATKPTPEMQALIADRLTTSRAKLGGGEAGIRATRVHPAPRPEAAPAIMQMARARAAEEIGSTRDPNWAERGMGTAVVAEYLKLKLPSKRLYELHLEAGNTPPSEGVIIDSQGRLAVQAIGYGDDHYLPFNLKNLKSLKGGEYVRNRSVGGLTSEDIYTGLVTGARRVTVVSRSGTFSMEFAPDFRGGRRHNDKARRMTRRYEQILDAVQSGKVDRQNIPPRWRKVIENEVKDEYGPGASRQSVRDEIDSRIKEFKEKPEIEGRDLDRAETLINDMEERGARGDVRESDVADYRRQVMNELRDMKEVRFRLNGIGYDAALRSLQEQFPYYIEDVRNKPTRDEANLEFEQDKGYVEPGRNRPTLARAGLHGTSENPGHKFTASHADYQRGRTGTGKLVNAKQAAAELAVGADTADAGFTTGSKLSPREEDRRRLRDQVAADQKVLSARKASVEVFTHLKRMNVRLEGGAGEPVWWGKTPDEMSLWLKTPDNAKEFDDLVMTHGPEWAGSGSVQGTVPGFAAIWLNYQRARGLTHAVKFQPSLAFNFPEFPYTFPDEKNAAYHAGASKSVVQREMSKISGEQPVFTSTRPLSQLTQSELSDELDVTNRFREQLFPSDPTVRAADPTTALEVHREDWSTSPSGDRLKPMLSQKGLEQHLENIHKIRYLQIMEAESKEERAAETATPSSSTGSVAVRSKPAGSLKPVTPAKPSPSPEDRALQRQTTDRYVTALDKYSKELGDLAIDAKGPERSSLIRSRGTVATVKNELGSNRFGPDLIDDHVKSRLGTLYDQFKTHLEST